MRELNIGEIESVSGGHWLDSRDPSSPFYDPGVYGQLGTTFNSGGSPVDVTTGPTTDEDGEISGWEASAEWDSDGDGTPDWDVSANTDDDFEAGYTFDDGVRISVNVGGGGDNGGIAVTVPLGGS